LVVVVCVAAAGGCKSHKPPGGTPIVRGAARELFLSPDGRVVATLVDAGPPAETAAPRDVLVGGLVLAPVDGSAPSRLAGGGVTNLPGSLLFSPGGDRIGFLSAWSFARASGDLRVAATAGGEARQVASDVTFFTFSGAGEQIAWVSAGELFVAPSAGGEPKSIARGVSMAEFGPAGTPAASRLLVKRHARSGGALLLHDLDAARTTAIAHGTASFGFAPDGAAFGFQAAGLLRPDQIGGEGPLGGARFELAANPGFHLVRGSEAPRRVTAEGASEFRFLPGGRLALLTLPQPGATTGDLLVADGEAAARRAAPRVARIAAAADGTLAVLGAYDDRSHLGTLGLLRPDGRLSEVARNVKDFALTPKKRWLLFSQTTNIDGHQAMVLATFPVAAAEGTKPRVVDSGVFGYVADRDEKRLAFKARCMDEARACSLFVTDLEGGARPVSVAARVAAFEFLPDGSDILVVTSRRAGKSTGKLVYTLGLVPAASPAQHAEVVPLDDVVGGDFVFGGPDGRRVAYTVNDAERPGVYVLDPRAAAAAAPR